MRRSPHPRSLRILVALVTAVALLAPGDPASTAEVVVPARSLIRALTALVEDQEAPRPDALRS